MKQKFRLWTVLPMLCLLLCACAVNHENPDNSDSAAESLTEGAYTDTQPVSEAPSESSETLAETSTETTTTTTTTATTTAETATSAETTTLPEAQPVHSPLYIEGVSVEDVLLYFNEVCLDCEFSYGGDSGVVQKWMQPIRYKVHGDATDKDMAALADTAAQLNAIPGFPGLVEAQEDWETMLPIYFCDGPELVDRMGSNFTEDNWGATTFWYEENMIYDAIICVRSDIDQFSRNSIIIEEIYNTLGPVQDTEYRTDSVIYQYSNDNQAMSEVDVLLLRLLYHPDMLCGMNAAECETVIRSLYY